MNHDRDEKVLEELTRDSNAKISTPAKEYKKALNRRRGKWSYLCWRSYGNRTMFPSFVWNSFGTLTLQRNQRIANIVFSDLDSWNYAELNQKLAKLTLSAK